MSRIKDKLDAACLAASNKDDRPVKATKVVAVERLFRNRQAILIVMVGLFGYMTGRSGSVVSIARDDLIAVSLAGGIAAALFVLFLRRFDKDVVKPGDSLKNANWFGLGFTVVMLALVWLLLVVCLIEFALEAYLVFGIAMIAALVVSLYRPALLYWLLALPMSGSSESASVDTPAEPVATV